MRSPVHSMSRRPLLESSDEVEVCAAGGPVHDLASHRTVRAAVSESVYSFSNGRERIESSRRTFRLTLVTQEWRIADYAIEASF